MVEEKGFKKVVDSNDVVDWDLVRSNRLNSGMLDLVSFLKKEVRELKEVVKKYENKYGKKFV